ncbi:hypothetical protein BAE44_0026268 [Dichanthelium oligosanthes]|uniref:F-box domain-containing protein n=1 Tax=Dichanthelium oligosanthes TaxID=888268 RepID=A0A1E5UIU2_9POAL|nr:hypothetical protein BAE44_0026268 [Dichanthelium oligosanthes]
MAPRRPRQPPELMAELIEEILLRVPPHHPTCLARATVVCKPWRRLLSDPAFRSRYCAFHRHQARPLLGFLHNHNTGGAVTVPRFVPTATPSLFPQRALDGCDGWCVLDCRHGRVLFDVPGESVNLVVWDPATGKRQELPEPRISHGRYTAAVLCAVHGCDHLCCHGGLFLVVLVGFNMQPHLYSSEAGIWTASADLGHRPGYLTTRRPTALIGDDIYFVLVPWHRVLRYNLGKNCSSIINPPAAHEIHGGVALMPMEDGTLGFAGLIYSKLYLWSRNVDPEVVAEWVQFRVIELRTLIPFASTIEVVGSVEGSGAIFVSTDVGVFTIELKSGRKKKVGEPGEYFAVFSFMSSFYIPGILLAFSLE